MWIIVSYSTMYTKEKFVSNIEEMIMILQKMHSRQYCEHMFIFSPSPKARYQKRNKNGMNSQGQQINELMVSTSVSKI